MAAVCLRDALQHFGLNATVTFFGCPAEEIAASRPVMIREGVFKDVDVVIDSHGGSNFNSTYGMLGSALTSFLVTFSGKTSHAAWKPWMGRSAADAVELMHAATERMREHMPPSRRIHWTTMCSGHAPNVRWKRVFHPVDQKLFQRFSQRPSAVGIEKARLGGTLYPTESHGWTHTQFISYGIIRPILRGGQGYLYHDQYILG